MDNHLGTKTLSQFCLPVLMICLVVDQLRTMLSSSITVSNTEPGRYSLTPRNILRRAFNHLQLLMFTHLSPSTQHKEEKKPDLR